MYGKMWLLLILVWFVKIGARACPFYQITIPQTNYSSVTDAIAGAAINGLPIRVCDGAETPASENVPVITDSVAFVGDDRGPPVPGAAFWIFGNLDVARTLLVVDADLVTFSNLRFEFAGTLVRVEGSGYVDFNGVTFAGGTASIYIAAMDTMDASTGAFCSNCYFVDNGVSVLYESGNFICMQCVVQAAREAGFVSRLDTPNPFANFDLQFVNFIDTQFTFVRQTSPGSAAVQLIVSKNYNFEHSIFYSRAFEDECPAAFGAGTQTKQTCPPVLSTTAELILILVSIAIFIMFLVMCIAATRRKSETFLTFAKKPAPRAQA